MIGIYKHNEYGLCIMKRDDIEAEAENILRNYCPDCLTKPMKVNIEKLIEDMGLKLCYANMSKQSNILGAFVFNKGIIPIYEDNNLCQSMYDAKTIIIDATIADADDPRLRFTYGHELGHYVTQYDIFHIDENQISLFDYDGEKQNAVICKRENIECNSFFGNHKKLVTKEDWQEWQANYFSSAILIPKSTLQIALSPYLENYDIMDQTPPLNKLEYSELEEVIKRFSKIFNVSNEMMINRLKGLKYLA